MKKERRAVNARKDIGVTTGSALTQQDEQVIFFFDKLSSSNLDFIEFYLGNEWKLIPISITLMSLTIYRMNL